MRAGGPAGGGAGQGADELGAADPGGVFLGDQLWGGGAEDRAGGGPGAGDSGFRLFQGGLRPGPPPGAGGGEQGGRVADVIAEVSDEAEHSPLSWPSTLHAHLILDDADLQAPAACGGPAGQVAVACQIYAFLPTGTLDARGQTGRIWLLRLVRVTR